MASQESSVCVLCRHEKVKIFAFGDCAHPVCNSCSTRMRVLCEQTYCAICRQELPRVYFVADHSECSLPVDESRFAPIDGTGECGIYFTKSAQWIRIETENLLRHFCPICHSEHESLIVLRDHVRRAHRQFYCDLCVEHLNLFTHERKCYTKSALIQHIQKGDPDDTSFKGHPSCRFCNDHFLDNDQLFKHMRQEHYYCHLCVSDNVYYSDYNLLREHYRDRHYLCEIGPCKDLQFENLFANEIDFRAHQASQHSKNRAESKHLGKLNISFQSTTTRGGNSSYRDNQGASNDSASRDDRDGTNRETISSAAVPSIDEFPSLGDAASTSQNSSQRGVWGGDSTRGIYSHQDFPALSNESSNPSNTSVLQSRGIWRDSRQQPMTTTNQSTTPKTATSTVKPVPNGVRTMGSGEDFPALTGAVNSQIPRPPSMASTWSNARQTAKATAAAKKGSQPQVRMNPKRFMNTNDDDDDDYFRRPMSSLTTGTTPMPSSNITLISSADLHPALSTHDQNRSIPGKDDFPALPSSNKRATKSTPVDAVWGEGRVTPQSSANEQKKKSGAQSKKKFLNEIRSTPTTSSSASTDSSSLISLSELGKRLIIDDSQANIKETIKQEAPVVTTEKIQENPQTSPEKKNKKKTNQTNDVSVIKSQIVQEEVPAKPPAPPPEKVSTSNESVSHPPGFSAPSTIPPPGFNSPSTPVYIHLNSYSDDKTSFRKKFLQLFNDDTNLCNEYENFCDAFAKKSINCSDFMKFTRELFHDKLEEYLVDLIVLIPNIEQQNEVYAILKKDFQSTTANNWTKINSDAKKLTQCRICRQILFENDMNEHNSHHSEFNNEFPSLPSAAVPLGRGKGKRK